MKPSTSGSLYFFADRLPPDIGGMETHAGHFIRHFGSDPHYRLASTFTSAADADVIAAIQHIASTSGRHLSPSSSGPPLTPCPAAPIFFFNSGRWIEHLGTIRRKLPNATLFQRTGGNDVIKADLAAMNQSLATRQQIWAHAINSHLDTIVANSKFTVERLKAIGVREDRILCVPGGVDAAACHAASLDRERLRRLFFGKHAKVPCILCASRLVPFKGVDTAIDAFGLAAHRRELALFIAGSGPLQKELLAHARQSGFATNITFMGPLTHEQCLRVTAAADAVLCLSRDWPRTVPGGTYIHTETMGRVACEALATGTPAIASRVGGLPEILGAHSPYLVPPNEPLAAADSLLHAINSGRLAAEAVESASTRFSWQQVFSQYKDAWNQHAA